MSAIVDGDLLDEELAPTLQNIIDQKSLRWIFVGGKGGVGKTTTSCSLAVQMAKVRERVLLISTGKVLRRLENSFDLRSLMMVIDPAHNLSDAFGQQFSKDAEKVENVDNLWAMEINPTDTFQEMIEQSSSDSPSGMPNGMPNVIQELAASLPGIDEAMSFAEVLKQVKSMRFEVIIFDTAPTGHTLRFLSFPTILEKTLAKVSEVSGRFGPLLNGLLGQQGSGPDNNFLSKLESMRQTVTEINKQFKDANLTTFIAVCIPEFLSVYETERMVQELTGSHMDIHCIVVNQMLFPAKGKIPFFFIYSKQNLTTCRLQLPAV